MAREVPLSTAAFESLLARLRADGPSAEVVYERLRARLVALLRLHAPAEAESLADVALDRVARRLHEGTVVENVYLYALGVGRMLILESHARAGRERRLERELAQASLMEGAGLAPSSGFDDPSSAEDEERMLAAITECLKRLGQSGSDLLLAYYSGDGAARIAGRERLAAELGISANALRNRALRLRGLLERCARERLGPDAPQHERRHDPRGGDESPGGIT